MQPYSTDFYLHEMTQEFKISIMEGKPIVFTIDC
jgi:hypothetical protein